MVMMRTVAVSALHEFVQLFGKLEGPCIIVTLMENTCVALKEFGVNMSSCEAETIFGGKLETILEHSDLLKKSGLPTEKTAVLRQYLLLFCFVLFFLLCICCVTEALNSKALQHS